MSLKQHIQKMGGEDTVINPEDVSTPEPHSYPAWPRLSPRVLTPSTPLTNPVAYSFPTWSSTAPRSKVQQKKTRPT